MNLPLVNLKSNIINQLVLNKPGVAWQKIAWFTIKPKRILIYMEIVKYKKRVNLFSVMFGSGYKMGTWLYVYNTNSYIWCIHLWTLSNRYCVKKWKNYICPSNTKLIDFQITKFQLKRTNIICLPKGMGQ